MASIKFCEHNLNKGTDVVVQKVKNTYPNADINVNPCLDHCKACSNGPFALIDDEIFSAATPEELYESIVKKLG